MPGYRTLAEDLVASAKRWQEWMDLPAPEEEPLPGVCLDLTIAPLKTLSYAFLRLVIGKDLVGLQHARML